MDAILYALEKYLTKLPFGKRKDSVSALIEWSEQKRSELIGQEREEAEKEVISAIKEKAKAMVGAPLPLPPRFYDEYRLIKPKPCNPNDKAWDLGKGD